MKYKISFWVSASYHSFQPSMISTLKMAAAMFIETMKGFQQHGSSLKATFNMIHQL
jgi:hypothetical protein